MSTYEFRLRLIKKKEAEFDEYGQLLEWLECSKIKKSRKRLLRNAISTQMYQNKNVIRHSEANLRLGSLWTEEDYALIREKCDGVVCTDWRDGKENLNNIASLLKRNSNIVKRKIRSMGFEQAIEKYD